MSSNDNTVEFAAPSFRWGTTATIVTSTLSFFLLLSLFSPELSQNLISFFLQLIGGLAVLSYVVITISYLRLNLLKLLLRYSGWAYHPRSPFTRIYLGLVGILGGKNPKLWRLQHTLPPLPVPDLQRTCDAYLESVKPLVSEEDFEKTKKAVAEFRKPGGVGQTLQKILIQRASTEKTSWLLEWWETFVYLKQRMPITIFSNWYGLDRVDPLLRSQVARAANLVNGLLVFKQMLETQSLEPNRVQGTVPLCMWQYSRIFGAVRVPGEEQDRLEFHNKSKHIVVICKDRFFKVNLYDTDGSPIPVTDIQTQFARILTATKDIDLKNDDEPKVGILTSENRTTWAKLRQELITMDDTNKKSLQAIETALFMLILEEDAPDTIEEMCRFGMHRKGKTLWYDKNFNMMVMSNGRFCSNVDHTWADASVMVHVFDFVFSCESSVDHWVPFDPNDKHLPQPEKLEWKVTDEIRKAIDLAQNSLNLLTHAVDVNVLKFQFFGKGLIKKFNMSPDAFCQMAIQLAYYKLHKQVVLAYESAATVRFRNGRTETVRSTSSESKKFCEAMDDESYKDIDRLKYLQAAVKKQTRVMRAATNGDGIDRHLLGLRILAAGSGMPMPDIFTDKAYQLEFKLSTSQTPAVGTLGGGFSPIAQDGYGVSYVVTEDRLWFHLTSYAQCPTTSSTKFSEALSQSLLDMQRVCFSNPAFTKKLSRRLYRIQRLE